MTRRAHAGRDDKAVSPRQLGLSHAYALSRPCPGCGAASLQPCAPTPPGVTCAARRTVELLESHGPRADVGPVLSGADEALARAVLSQTAEGTASSSSAHVSAGRSR